MALRLTKAAKEEQVANRPYSKLGKVIDDIARARNLRGAKAISERVKERMGRGPGRSAWQQILYGDSWPQPTTITLFKNAMDLTYEEEVTLAREYAFRQGRVTAA